MNRLYEEDLENVANSIDINALKNKTLFITGANGLIGRFIVDLIMYINKAFNKNITIIANSRSLEKISEVFSNYINNKNFKYYIGDINNKIEYSDKVDYIINCASNTHPLQYSQDPINTILTNIKGTENVLDFASNKNARVVFLSSVEIYGENVNNIGRFKENQMGYIDCNSLRAGYNESKRAGEALCQAYKESKNVDVVLTRLPRIFGSTVKIDDSKVMSQFINKAINNEDIILKSAGTQFFSYLYVADAASGIFEVMLNGKNGEVYNLGNKDAEVHLRDLAKIIAESVGKEVVFDMPSEMEEKGFSKASDARLDYSKIEKELNWKPQYSIENAIDRTIKILKEK